LYSPRDSGRSAHMVTSARSMRTDDSSSDMAAILPLISLEQDGAG